MDEDLPNALKNKAFESLSLRGRKQLGQSFPVRKESLKYVLAYNTTRKLPEAAPRTLQLPLDTTKVSPAGVGGCRFSDARSSAISFSVAARYGASEATKRNCPCSIFIKDLACLPATI
jgi:hypothetical protein